MLQRLSRFFIFFPVLLVVYSLAVNAVESPPTIIVTATRVAQTTDETLAAVSVITRDDIERSQAKSVSELLAGLPGIDTTVQGGYGKTSSINIRGTNSNHVLVLIDGIKAGSATLGTTALELIPIDQIERIEVVRGPRSSLYGSEAIGGVVQIFTRKGSDKPYTHVEAGIGGDETRTGSLIHSGKWRETGYSLSLSGFKTDGFNAIRSDNPYGIDEPDNDGYKNYSLSMRVNQRFAKNAELDMHFLGAKGNTQFDGFPGSPNQADFMQQVAGLGLNFSPATNWNVSLKGGDYKDKYESFRNNSPSVSRQVFDTDRRTLTWQNNILLPHDQILTAGMDLTRDSVDSTTQFSTTKRDNIGAYLQTQYSFYRQDLLLGLRYDDNDSFGNYTTSNIAWGFKFNHRIRLYTSYGTAFKAPTFNDLYYPDVGYYKGNPDLNPENSRSFEVGLTGKTDSSHWNIRFYHTNIDNLIVYFTDENFVGTMQNVDRARIKGLEASYSKRVGYWQLSTTLSLVDPKNLQTAKALPGRARKTVKFNLEHQNGKTVTGLTILAQDYRYDGVTGDKIPGYGITNFYTRYPLGKNWILHGRINNLFDKRYETVEFYNEPRRNAFISIAYQL